MSSLTPWLSDFHTVQFSVRSGCFVVFNMLVAFFWVCKEAQYVYLCLLLGWKLSLVPFELLPQHLGSEGVSPSKSVCGSFKRKCLGLQQFVFHRLNSCWLFKARSSGDFPSWHWNSVLGAWCQTGTPCSSGWGLCSYDIPPDFYLPHMGVGPALSAYLPLLQSLQFLLYTLSCRTFTHLDFR